MSLEPVLVVAHIPNASPSERIYTHVYFGKSSNTETFSGVPIAKAKENGIYVFRLNVFPFVPFAIKLQRWTTVKMEDRPSSSSPSPSPSPSPSLTPDCASREAAAGDGKKESITVLEWQARRIVVEKSWTVIFIEWDQPTRKLLLLSAGDPRYLFAGKYPVQKFPLETNFLVRSSSNNWNAGPRLSDVHEFPPGSGIFWSWLFGSLKGANEYKMVATIGGNAFGDRTIIVWEPLPFRNKSLRPNIPQTFYLLFSDWGEYTDEYKAVDMKKSIIYDSHEEEATHGVGCTKQDGANPVSIWQRYLSQLAAAPSAAAAAAEEKEPPAPSQTVSQASLVTVESVTAEDEENEVVFCSSCKAQDLREELERLTRTMEGPGTEVRDAGRGRRLLLLSGGSVMTASCASGECSSSVEMSNSKNDQPSGDEPKTRPLGSGAAADGFEDSGREFSENSASVEDISATENVEPVQETTTENNTKLENGSEFMRHDARLLSKRVEKLDVNSFTKDLQDVSAAAAAAAAVPGIREPFVNSLKTSDELKMTHQEFDELIEEFAKATEAVQMREGELTKLRQKIVDKRCDNSEVKPQEFDRSDNDDDDYEYEDDDDDYDKPFRRFETYYNRLKTIEEEADIVDESSSPGRCADDDLCSAVQQRSSVADSDAQKKEDTEWITDPENGAKFLLEGSACRAIALTEAASDEFECVVSDTVQKVLDEEPGSLIYGDAKPLLGDGEEIACDVDVCSPYSMPATPDTLSSGELRALQTVMERYPCDERSYKTYKYFLRNSQNETVSCRQCIDRSLLRDIIPFFTTGDDDDDDDDDDDPSGSFTPGQLDPFAGTGGEISGPFDSQQKPQELRGITETQLKCHAQGVELCPTDETVVCSEDLEPDRLEYEAAATGRVRSELSVGADTDVSCEEADGFERDYSNSSRGRAVRSRRLLKRADSGDRFVIRGEDIDRVDGVEEVKVFRPCVFLTNRFIGQELAYCVSPPPPDYAQFDDSDGPDDDCHVTEGGGTGNSWSVREKKLVNAADDDDDDAVPGGFSDNQLLKFRGRETRSPVDKNPCSHDAWKCLKVTEDESSAAKAPNELPVLDSSREDTPTTRSPVLDLTADDSFETCRSDISEPDTECQVDREERVCQKERFFRVPKCVLNGIVNYESDYESDTASKFPTVDSPDPVRMSRRLGLKKHMCDYSSHFSDDLSSVGQKCVDGTANDCVCNMEGVCHPEDKCPASLGTGDGCTRCGDSVACPNSISLNEKCDSAGKKSFETDQCHQELCGAGHFCDKNSAPFEDDWYLDESEDRTDQSEDKMRTEFRRRRLEEILESDSKFREILERKNFEFSFNQSMDYTLGNDDEEEDDEEEDEENLDVRNFAIFPAATMDFVLEDFDEGTENEKDVDSSVEKRKDPGSTEAFQWDDYMDRPPSPFADDWYADPGHNSFTAFLERNSSAALEDLIRKRTAILEQYHDSVLSGKAAIVRRISVHTTDSGQKELELPSESTFLRGTSSGDQLRSPREGSREPLPCDDLGKLEKAEISASPPEKEICNGENVPSVVTTLPEESVPGICERGCVQDLADVGHSSEEEGDSNTDSSAHLSVESSSTCEKHADVIKDGVSESSICSEGTDPCPILVPVSSSSELAGAAEAWSQSIASIETASDNQCSNISMQNSEPYANEDGDVSTVTDVTAGFLVTAAICKAQDNIHAKDESTTSLSAESQAHDSGDPSELEILRIEDPGNTMAQEAETVYFS